jgi:hypothetical protein
MEGFDGYEVTENEHPRHDYPRFDLSSNRLETPNIFSPLDLSNLETTVYRAASLQALFFFVVVPILMSRFDVDRFIQQNLARMISTRSSANDNSPSQNRKYIFANQNTWGKPFHSNIFYLLTFLDYAKKGSRVQDAYI